MAGANISGVFASCGFVACLRLMAIDAQHLQVGLAVFAAVDQRQDMIAVSPALWSEPLATIGAAIVLLTAQPVTDKLAGHGVVIAADPRGNFTWHRHTPAQ